MCRSRTSNDSQASWATLEVVIAPLFSSESAYTTLSHQCEKTFIERAFFVRIEHERNIFSVLLHGIPCRLRAEFPKTHRSQRRVIFL